MSKSSFRKFKKNDYFHDEDEFHDDVRNRMNKRHEKRVERALRTKDISALVEDEDQDQEYDLESNNWKY